MPDQQTADGAKPPQSETDPSFDPTKVQDLAKAGRDDVDPKEAEE